jgi:hypothetical protein
MDQTDTRILMNRAGTLDVLKPHDWEASRATYQSEVQVGMKLGLKARLPI